MTRQESDLECRTVPPKRNDGKSSPAVIMLHGRGADEGDLLALAPYLDERLLVIGVRAPYRFSYGGYTWYSIDESGEPDLGEFRSSYDRLVKFVQTVADRFGIDPERLFLFGFSMGTMMSFALSLTLPTLFRGVIAHSGYVPESSGLAMQWSGLDHTGFFVAHGTFDPVIPVRLARRTEELFKQSDAQWVYREYPIGHEISPESLGEAASWLRDHL